MPEIVENAVEGVSRRSRPTPAALDVGSIGATCNFSLNEQGLLAGLVAPVPGLEAKPIESVENACASGGQAMLSVIHKLQSGLGDTGIAIGYEKMRDAEGKMDGKLIGKVLGYFSHPDERPGKVFVFPHIFAEVMDVYMKTHGVPEEDLAHDRRPGVPQRASTTRTRRCGTSTSRSRRPCRSRASTATSSRGCRSRPTTARRSPTATPG